MQLDLKKLPFGQGHSRHLLFEEIDPLGYGFSKGIFLALAHVSVSMFTGLAVRPAGMIRLAPFSDGRTLEMTAEATPSQAVLTTEAGQIRFAIDGKALLMRSDGPGLGMTISLGRGETISKLGSGYVLNMGAARYIIDIRKGSGDVSVQWDLEALHSTDPLLTLTPEDGVLDVIFWDSDPTYAKPACAPDVDAAAEKATAAFDAFRGGLRGADERNAYVFWLGYMDCRGEELLISNKIGDVKALTRNQLLSALALKRPDDVIAQLCAVLRLMTPGGLQPAWVTENSVIPEAAPPLWGLALESSGIAGAEPAALEECYTLLKKAVGWWQRERCAADGTFFYAYTHESGWDHAPLLPDSHPAVSPDLAGWMMMNFRALGHLAEALGLSAEAAQWNALAEGQTAVLRSLWDGQRFVCRDLYSDAAVPCTDALDLLPLSLGEALPEDVRSVLSARTELPAVSPLIACLIALGCPALRKVLPEKGSAREHTLSGAAYDPTVSALLLALEERS